MNKKYFPSTGLLCVIALLIISFRIFYGMKVPDNMLFAKFFQSLGPIGGALSFFTFLSCILGGMYVITILIINYDQWRKS
jgi:hypothetical protein